MACNGPLGPTAAVFRSGRPGHGGCHSRGPPVKETLIAIRASQNQLDIVTRKIFYGWHIVGVGFICYLGSSFALSSTLSIFLKPLTTEFGISRGVFSFIRSGEVMLSSVIAALVGPLIDRDGARWLIVTGALVGGTGFILLSQIQEFWQFMVIRWLPVTVGDTLISYMVVNVMISRWFIRKRGRAIAIANTGNGLAKASMPLLAVWLFALVGWRNTWMVFGLLTLAMVVLPAFLLVRRSPEDMGLQPDGALAPHQPSPGKTPEQEALQAPAGRYHMDARGGRPDQHVLAVGHHLRHRHLRDHRVEPAHLSLHYGHRLFTQDRRHGHGGDVPDPDGPETSSGGWSASISTCARRPPPSFSCRCAAWGWPWRPLGLASVYLGFVIYGFGLGGILVIRELLWADYFGRISLGRVRNLGIMITRVFTTVGPPFFGFFHDYTGSYSLSFGVFIGALLLSAFLVLFIHPPRKVDSGAGEEPRQELP